LQSENILGRLTLKAAKVPFPGGPELSGVKETTMAFTGVKVFSATKAREREELGENVTRWIRANPGVQVTDKIVTQSSDREFHCLTITLFYAHAEAAAAR
jgi:hypothetical protein